MHYPFGVRGTDPAYFHLGRIGNASPPKGGPRRHFVAWKNQKSRRKSFAGLIDFEKRPLPLAFPNEAR
jgi:hypothetical protein